MRRTERKTGGRIWGRVKVILVVALMAVSAAAGALVYRGVTVGRTPQVTAAEISEKISEASELTAAVLEYKGLIVYSDGNIPFITQKGFSMTYTAEARAGVDVSDIRVEVGDDTVTVTLPKATVQSIEVAPASIAFYDEKHALFNWSSKDDVVDAVNAAKSDAETHIDKAELIATAEKKTNLILTELLRNAVGSKELVLAQK